MKKVSILLLVGIAALAAFGLSLWISETVFHRSPITTDEQSYMLQAHLFASGKIKHEPPPILSHFQYPMVIVDPEAGWLSRYPLGHSLWLMFGSWLGHFYFMIALAAACGVALTGLAARRIGASVPGVLLLLLASPFYLFTFGTLMSHTSGYVAAAGMILAYVLWHQTGKTAWAAVSGAAWAWLFMNRTYTALLMALPFAVDALWFLWLRRREVKAWWGTIAFAGLSCSGVVAVLLYNYLAVGDPFTMTYLFYDPTDGLGFGPRHYGPLVPKATPYVHTLANGFGFLKDNLLLLDRWMFGFRGGLIVWAVLTIAGWDRRWSGLLVASTVAIGLGYVYFWYPGWNETGPNYYVEAYPALVLAAGLGMAKLWRLWHRRIWFYPALGAFLIVWGYGAVTLAMEQGRYLRDQTRLRRQLTDVIDAAPAKTLIFMNGRVTSRAWAHNDQAFHPHALKGPVIVARWLESSNRALWKRFPDYRPAMMAYGQGGFYLEFLPDGPPFDTTYPLGNVFRRTGTNEWDKDEPRLFVRLAREGEHAAEFLMYGRHFELYPGRFILEFDIKATRDDTATIDVATESGRRILITRDVPASDEWATVQLLLEPDGFLTVEPRIWYHGVGDIYISRMHLYEVTDSAAESTE